MNNKDSSLNYSIPLTAVEYRGYIYFLNKIVVKERNQSSSLEVVKLLFKLKDFFVKELAKEYVDLKNSYLRKDFYSQFEVDYSSFVKLRKQPVRVNQDISLHIDEFIIFTLKITADYLNSIPYMERLNNQITAINQKEDRKRNVIE